MQTAANSAKHLCRSGKFRTGVYPSLLTLKNRSKFVADHVTNLSLWIPAPSALEGQKKNHLFNFFCPAFWSSVALSQLEKRHEINVMSMAFSHETPKALSQSHLA